MARVTPSGNITVGDSPQASVGLSGANVGVGDENASVGAGVNPSGVVGFNASQDIGDNTVGIGGGFNPSSGSVGVFPTVQIGDGPGSRYGAQAGGTIGAGVGGTIGSVGGPAGTAAGAAVGSVVGSTIGSIGGSISDSLFGGGSRSYEGRETVLNSFMDVGGFEDSQMILPDGTKVDFSAGYTRGAGRRPWFDSRRATADGDRELFGFETDYTNDLDFISGMGGITLSRLLSGESNKDTDQIGQLFGNQMLGTAGFGAELTPESFSVVMTNMRSLYSKFGISSKEDYMSLASTAYAEGRLSEFEYTQAIQNASLVFDNDYETAQKLMNGRWKGAKTASQGKARVNRPGRIYSARISPEEAMLSVKPYFDAYRQNATRPRGPSGTDKTVADVVKVAGAVTAVAGAAKYVGNVISGGSGGGNTTSTPAPSTTPSTGSTP